MRIGLLAVGRLKAGPERELATRYTERFDALARRIGLHPLDVREIDESRARRPEARRADEAKALAALLPSAQRWLVLDERGRHLSSAAFAQVLADARDTGSEAFTLLIGGPDGIEEGLRERASLVVALGAMTWPHQLVRVLLAEQLYRAATILSGHPYHRA
jgi:23S rRNA (pseudouridine1915-N3)-methyltransferase